MDYNYEEIGFTNIEEPVYKRRYLFRGKDVADMGVIYPHDSRLVSVLLDGASLEGVRSLNPYKRLRSVRALMKEAMYNILDRVVDGDIFEAKNGDKIYARAIPDDIVPKICNKGVFSELNIVKANYQLPEVVYQFKSGEIRLIYLFKQHRDKLFKNLETGKLVLPKVVTKI
jgi:hypothetical protein